MNILVKEIINWALNVILSPIFITAITYFFLDTIRNYKKVVGKIDSALLFYQNILCTPRNNEEINCKCRESLRKLAGDFGAVYNAVPFTSIFGFVKFVPRRKQLQESVKNLGFISNNVGDTKDESGSKNSEAIKSIRKNLKICSNWV